jgi:hypothetical protein
MKAPMDAYIKNKSKNGNQCYDAKNNDYEGGYYAKMRQARRTREERERSSITS